MCSLDSTEQQWNSFFCGDEKCCCQKVQLHPHLHCHELQTKSEMQTTLLPWLWLWNGRKTCNHLSVIAWKARLFNMVMRLGTMFSAGFLVPKTIWKRILILRKHAVWCLHMCVFSSCDSPFRTCHKRAQKNCTWWLVFRHGSLCWTLTFGSRIPLSRKLPQRSATNQMVKSCCKPQMKCTCAKAAWINSCAKTRKILIHLFSVLHTSHSPSFSLLLTPHTEWF